METLLFLSVYALNTLRRRRKTYKSTPTKKSADKTSARKTALFRLLRHREPRLLACPVHCRFRFSIHNLPIPLYSQISSVTIRISYTNFTMMNRTSNVLLLLLSAVAVVLMASSSVSAKKTTITINPGSTSSFTGGSSSSSINKNINANKSSTGGNFRFCCLCDNCNRPVSNRGGLKITSSGDTCNTMSLKMARESAGSSTCSSNIGRYRNSCCNANSTPKAVAQSQQKAANPISSYKKGNEPTCHVCADGKFPRNPNVVTAILYMPGNPKCEDLYYMGRQGSIPDRLCNPLQDYFQQPCGCNPH